MPLGVTVLANIVVVRSIIDALASVKHSLEVFNLVDLRLQQYDLHKAFEVRFHFC